MKSSPRGREAWSALVTCCERCSAWQMALQKMEESSDLKRKKWDFVAMFVAKKMDFDGDF